MKVDGFNFWKGIFFTKGKAPWASWASHRIAQVALHWSLTQFTPAAMDVQPQNTLERAMAGDRQAQYHAKTNPFGGGGFFPAMTSFVSGHTFTDTNTHTCTFIHGLALFSAMLLCTGCILWYVLLLVTRVRP